MQLEHAQIRHGETAARVRGAHARALRWLLAHLALFLGLFQVGYTPDQWQALRSEIARRGDLGAQATWQTLGPIGLVRAYFRTNSDERLFREYAELTLTGSADFEYLAEKHGSAPLRPSAPRPWPYRDVRIEY